MISNILLLFIGFSAGVIFSKWQDFKQYFRLAKDAAEVTKNIKQLKKYMNNEPLDDEEEDYITLDQPLQNDYNVKGEEKK